MWGGAWEGGGGGQRRYINVSSFYSYLLSYFSLYIPVYFVIFCLFFLHLAEFMLIGIFFFFFFAFLIESVNLSGF